MPDGKKNMLDEIGSKNIANDRGVDTLDGKILPQNVDKGGGAKRPTHSQETRSKWL